MNFAAMPNSGESSVASQTVMAKKAAVKKSPTVAVRLDNIERLISLGFQQVDQRFEQVDQRFEQIDKRFQQFDLRVGGLEFEVRDLRREMNERFAIVDERFNTLANHIDSFMKLDETLDIEFKVIKEQMSRMEARLKALEAAR